VTVTRSVDLSDVLRMLDECAPGHARADGKHKIRVTWEGRKCDSFPTGAKWRKNRDVPSDKVRMLIRQLQIPTDCARRIFPNIGIKDRDEAVTPATS